MKINKKLIKELVSCLEENKLSELEYSEKDIKIKVSRNSINDNSKIQVVQNTNEVKEKKIISGTEIKKGDTVMIVEAMKTMNHVPSSKDGVVKEIAVDDGQPVEFGQTLVILE